MDKCISESLNVEFTRCVSDNELNNLNYKKSNIPGPNKGRIFGKDNPMYGKKHSEHSKKIMSEKHKNQTPWNKGKIGVYSKKTINKMSESNRAENNNQFKGYYITPWGKLTTAKNHEQVSHATLRRWCKNPNIEVSPKAYARSKYLQSLGKKEKIVGKTYLELGFNFDAN